MAAPVTAAMSLVDEGKLALRDPIVRWLPEFSDMRVLDDQAGRWTGCIGPSERSWPTVLA